MSDVQRLAYLLSVALILAIWVFALWMLLMWYLFCGCKRNLSFCYARLFTFSPFVGDKGDTAVVGCRLFISFFPPIYERAHPHTCRRDWVLWFNSVGHQVWKPRFKHSFHHWWHWICVCVCVYLWMDDVHPHGGKPSALLKLPIGM